jgi:hypothetical protein
VIYWPAVAFSTFVVLVWLFVALFPWQAWAEMLRRGWKYVTVAYQQMPGAERQTFAMGAGIVVWFVWWSVAIVKGW